MYWDTGSVEVVVLETANVECPGGHLCILTKEPVLVAALHTQHSVGTLGLDGNVLLLQWSVLFGNCGWEGLGGP